MEYLEKQLDLKPRKASKKGHHFDEDEEELVLDTLEEVVTLALSKVEETIVGIRRSLGEPMLADGLVRCLESSEEEP
jgi:hypothetical protein